VRNVREATVAAKARDRLLSSAVELIRRNGVAATGIAELAAHSCVARRTIYLNFPGGKDELIAEATRAAAQFIDAAIGRVGNLDDPAKAIDGYITIWKQTLEASDFREGCPITAAALAREVAPGVPSVAGESFERWRTMLAEQLHTRGHSHARSRTIATTVIAAIEGAVIMSLADNSVRPLDDIRPHLTALVTTTR